MAQVCGKQVGRIGYGLMGLTWRKTPVPDEQAFAAMKASLEAGCNMWNGGQFYGTPEANSLTLLKRYFTKHPEDVDKVVLSIKGGVNLQTLFPTGTKEGVATSIKACLDMAGGAKKIDTFECARVDKNVPIEDTMKFLKAHVDAGDIGGISLSEVSAATINRAAKVVKIDTVEIELSIWSPDVLTNGVAKACAENNIVMVAYSPLGRGVLTGAIKSHSDIPEDSFLNHLPRYQKEAFEDNMKLSNAVAEIAKRKGCTPAQLAVGWVLALQRRPGMPTIIPIPGSSTVERVKENSTFVEVTDAEMDEIDKLMQEHRISGGRYMAGHPIEG